MDEEDLHDDIDPEDVQDEKAIDDDGLPYNADAGNREPEEGRCNAILRKWRERYNEPRFCAQLPYSQFGNDVEHDYCYTHSNRAHMDTISAEELTHGLSAKSRDHLFRNLDAWKQVYAYGVFESLMGDSSYEFAPEHDVREFDFSNSDVEPTIDGQEGPIYEVAVPFATQFKDREIALLSAAIDSIKMMEVQSIIWEDEMRTETTAEADFTTTEVVGEDGGGTVKSWQTIEEFNEHYLNLPYSRLVRDRADLLEYGGVETTESADESNVSVAELDSLMTPQADPAEESPIRERAEDAEMDTGPSVDE